MKKVKLISDDYTIENREKKEAVTLTRGEWAAVLLWLGPDDATSATYDKIDAQVKIFGGDEDLGDLVSGLNPLV